MPNITPALHVPNITPALHVPNITPALHVLNITPTLHVLNITDVGWIRCALRIVIHQIKPSLNKPRPPMSEYRRVYQPGAHYFFTLVTYKRRPIFANPDNIKHLKTAINKVKKKHPFSLNAIVILPDHLHCLWKLPENDPDFSTRWRLIKQHFSKEIDVAINHRNEKEVWQRRFWEHAIRDENDWQRHMDYIHYNPVKHELAAAPKDWEPSSFHYWVEKGVYERDWGSVEPGLLVGMKDAE